MKSIIHNQEGISAVIAVVVVLALVLSLGLAVSQLSVGELVLTAHEGQSSRALHYAEACVEEAGFRLKRDSSYTGGTITFDEGTCTVSVAGSGSTRTFTVTATVENETRSLVVDVTRTANTAATSDGIDVTNWEE